MRNRIRKSVRRARPLVIVALSLLLVPVVRAGCLAPSDTTIDGAGAVGVFWGSSAGELLYARDVTGTSPQLMRRGLGTGSEIVAEAGTRNDFQAFGSFETWAAFHAGTINSSGDLAFVASTTVDDDPETPRNEGLARRGAYVQRGNTMIEIGRFGGPSPIRGGLGQQIPWGSFFAAAAEARGAGGFLRAVFSAQLGAPDGRTGIFRWDGETFDIAPLLLVGDASPSGGEITTVGRMRANEAGDVAFFALSRVGGMTTPGLFLIRDDGSRLRLVRFGLDGDAAPGGGMFSILNDFAVADDATVVFSATVAGGKARSGLFRAAPPTFQPERVVLEGDATPLGGSFGTFEPAKVRVAPSGDVIFGVALSDDIGGEGVFAAPAGTVQILPLANPDSTLAIAILGDGSAAYQTETETHTVVPADGSEEGPNDFRVSKLDVKNNVPLEQDTVRFAGAFRLPPVGDGPGRVPPVVVGPGAFERFSPQRSFTGDDLTRIRDVSVSVSQSPGNNFVFGFDDAGGGTMTFNGVSQKAPRVKQARDGSSAVWSFRSSVGRGRFTLDVARGVFDLRLAQGTINPSFEPAGLRVGVTLRTAADLAAGRTGDEAFFHHSMAIGAGEKPFGRGRRIVSRGESVAGGTLFVDTLAVKRKLRIAGGQAAPIVDSDVVKLTGTLRICPGGSPPGTPGLTADLRLGDLDIAGVTLRRRGRSGSRYRFKSAKGAAPAITLDVDVRKGTFRIKAKELPPLSQLVDADFSGAAIDNGSGHDVSGMELPFRLSLARVYEGAFDIPMTRRRGGKIFTK